jgi:2-polyprenyl-6-methoxyphenol hydroxylase-like FAD-dependent oxidoreductase
MTHVLISGASVAGPALAHWLHRHGTRTTIVERAESVRPGGLAVDFRGTAMRVLDEMGIVDELRAQALTEYERALRDYVSANQAMGRQARDMFGMAPTQEMYDALAAADTAADSPDNVVLRGYANLTVR